MGDITCLPMLSTCMLQEKCKAQAEIKLCPLNRKPEVSRYLFPEVAKKYIDVPLSFVEHFVRVAFWENNRKSLNI